jgi:hypothetical protein
MNFIGGTKPRSGLCHPSEHEPDAETSNNSGA